MPSITNEVNIITKTKTIRDKDGKASENEITIVRIQLMSDNTFREVKRITKVVPALQFLDILQLSMQYDHLITL